MTYPLPLYKSGQISNSKSGQLDRNCLKETVDIKDDERLGVMSKSGQIKTLKSGQINASKSGQNTDIPKGYKSGDESRAKIIEAMRKNPEISRRELSILIGISSSAIQRHIEYLKLTGIIVRLGSDRKGLWKVVK